MFIKDLTSGLHLVAIGYKNEREKLTNQRTQWYYKYIYSPIYIYIYMRVEFYS